MWKKKPRRCGQRAAWAGKFLPGLFTVGDSDHITNLCWNERRIDERSEAVIVLARAWPSE